MRGARAAKGMDVRSVGDPSGKPMRLLRGTSASTVAALDISRGSALPKVRAKGVKERRGRAKEAKGEQKDTLKEVRVSRGTRERARVSQAYLIWDLGTQIPRGMVTKVSAIIAGR